MQCVSYDTVTLLLIGLHYRNIARAHYYNAYNVATRTSRTHAAIHTHIHTSTFVNVQVHLCYARAQTGRNREQPGHQGPRVAVRMHITRTACGKDGGILRG